MVSRDPGVMPAGALTGLADYVIRNQIGTWNAIQRHTHVGYTTLVTLLAELEHLGILGPAGPRAARDVLVPYIERDAALDKVRAYERGDLP